MIIHQLNNSSFRVCIFRLLIRIFRIFFTQQCSIFKAFFFVIFFSIFILFVILSFVIYDITFVCVSSVVTVHHNSHVRFLSLISFINCFVQRILIQTDIFFSRIEYSQQNVSTVQLQIFC